MVNGIEMGCVTGSQGAKGADLRTLVLPRTSNISQPGLQTSDLWALWAPLNFS